MSTQESPWPPSCTLCKLGPTPSNLPTSVCATPQFWCSWKLSARGSLKGAPIFQRNYSSYTSIHVQQQLRATWSNPTIASKAPIIIQHRWPNRHHQSYLFLTTYPCTPGQHTAHDQDPMSLLMTMTNQLQIYFVLELLQTRIAASSTTTSQDCSLSCPLIEVLFFCTLPLWIQCHPCKAHHRAGQHEHLHCVQNLL